ncbi:MAG: pyruvate dehydrogenase (acetyl-transferring) E1 component subunit alpha [Armatimonadota bacterium]
MEQKIGRQPEGLGQFRTRFLNGANGNGAAHLNAQPALVQVLDDDGVPVQPVGDIAAEDLRSMYEWMLRVRTFDTRMLSLQRQGRIHFFVPSFGEEAAQIGTACALQPEDWVFPAYREQGVALYRGYPLQNLLCQMLGNAEDFLRGRQMPDHFGSPRYRFAVASSPVGTQIPQAVGAAWSARLRREESVAVVYFGDGATSTGDFHAGMNFAAVQQLPVVFVCKNNGWAISLPRAKQCRAESLADKAAGYGMPGVRVDGNDILAVYEVTKEAAEWARSGSGPIFLELITQRMGSHSTSDDPTRYRDPELLEPWKKKEPIGRFRKYLEARKLWSAQDEQRAVSEADSRITQALKWAESLPRPSLESMFEDVYAEMPWHLREQLTEARGAGE